jgi:hypothetical protein
VAVEVRSVSTYEPQKHTVLMLIAPVPVRMKSSAAFVPDPVERSAGDIWTVLSYAWQLPDP